jgi:hypothetical protein
MRGCMGGPLNLRTAYPPKGVGSWGGDHFVQVKSENEGLISTDRGTKTTLMRTIPRSILSRLQRIRLSEIQNYI